MTDIKKTFAPNDDKELGELMRIEKESMYIDIKPYSHNIVGLSLRILSETYKYDDEKIKLVVKTFGLDKKGWGYLLGEDRNTDVLYKCEFCGVANTMDFMYWVQGAVSYVDDPNCCADCVEDEDDSDDEEDE
jgi:hypothetical protein